MKIVVLSDLHAFCSAALEASSEKAAPSFIDFSSTSRTANVDPLIGFEELFRGGHVEAPDLLIVAGDLGDRADPQAIERVWSTLSTLAAGEKRTKLVGAVGNHDLDSRHTKNKFDPRGFVRSLSPAFPFADSTYDDLNILEYWANNFSLIESSSYRLLNVNSCAFHGYGPDAARELDHGRVSDITLEAIKRKVEISVSAAPHKHNVCLFHHHIRPVSTDDFDDSSPMKGSENLAHLLSEHKMGEWLFLHGHRHRSDLFCAGGNTAPIVLSCASFAATRVNDLNNSSPNQFYEITISDVPEGTRSKTEGTLKSWNWVPGMGWLSEQSIPGGLPVSTGFGFRGHIPTLATEIALRVKESGKLSWAELESSRPETKFLMPTDQKALSESLDENGIVVTKLGETILELAVRND